MKKARKGDREKKKGRSKDRNGVKKFVLKSLEGAWKDVKNEEERWEVISGERG